MPALDSCCCFVSNRSGTIAIGSLLLAFTVVLTGVSVGFIAGWEDFDLSFLGDTSNTLRAACKEQSYVGNCTNREWVATRVDSLHERLAGYSQALASLEPVWKKQFISLFAFLPWYGLACVLLVLGAVKEIKILLLLWILATIIALLWEFVLLSILFSYDTTVSFVLTFALLHLANFSLLSYFIVIVFSYYQELTATTIKRLLMSSSDFRLQTSEAIESPRD